MFWVLMGTGGYQIIRLASNLILTRLLFPEAFGIMAIVTAIMIGLNQLSDIGVREGVVNSNRIDDPSFMRTAWTLQVVQAGAVALVLLAISQPIAYFYDEPLLVPIMAVTAITMFTTGFRSIALLAYDKRMELKTQVKCDLFTQITSLVIIIVWASIWPSVWALVAGHLVASLLEIILSYRLFKGHFSRFAWDKETVNGLFHFGKWILISSAISYITIHGDKLIMGKFMTKAELGIYNNAATWAAMITLIAYDLSRRVLHPFFKKSFDNQSDFRNVRHMRLLLNSGYVVVCIGLALLGDKLIAFLYDDRYIEGGWMLQILALGQIGRSMSGTLMPFLLAKGDSFSQMVGSAFSAFFMITLLYFGGAYFGTIGLIIGYALTGFLTHPVMVFLAARHGYNCSIDDFLLIAACTGIVITGWVMTQSTVVDKLSALPIPI